MITTCNDLAVIVRLHYLENLKSKLQNKFLGNLTVALMHYCKLSRCVD